MQQNAQAVFRARDRTEIKNIQQSIELKQVNKNKLETQFKMKQLKLITNRKRNQKATSKKDEFTFSFKLKKKFERKYKFRTNVSLRSLLRRFLKTKSILYTTSESFEF